MGNILNAVEVGHILDQFVKDLLFVLLQWLWGTFLCCVLHCNKIRKVYNCVNILIKEYCFTDMNIPR